MPESCKLECQKVAKILPKIKNVATEISLNVKSFILRSRHGLPSVKESSLKITFKDQSCSQIWAKPQVAQAHYESPEQHYASY